MPTTTPITDTINSWRSTWASERSQDPSDDEAWEEYLNSLTNAELLYNLELYEIPEGYTS